MPGSAHSRGCAEPGIVVSWPASFLSASPPLVRQADVNAWLNDLHGPGEVRRGASNQPCL